MACETPVVTTRVGLVPEVIIDGVTGFSAEVNDVPALTTHLQSLASAPKLRLQIGTSARAAVSGRRSWEETLRQLELPLARMTARATPKPSHANAATHQAAANLARAVHTADDLLWGVVSCAQRVISPTVAFRLIRSCWEGYTPTDILRGLALLARLNFRTAAMRKLLGTTGTLAGAPIPTSTEPAPKSAESLSP
jgi:ribosomal protein S14